MGLVLVGTALTGTALVGVATYRVSHRLVEEHFLETDLMLARSFADELQVTASATRDEVLARATGRWQRMVHPYARQTLCVIDADGRLAFHSRRPERVGTAVGAVALDPATGVVADLIARRADWTGRNVSAFGMEQVAAYAYAPGWPGLVALHVPADEVAARVRRSALPWALGSAGGFLVLASLGAMLLFLAWRRRDAALAVERSRAEALLRLGEDTLRQQRRRVLEARDEERRVLAEELHDALGGILSGLHCSLAAKQARGPDLGAEMAIAEKALQHLRNVSHLLDPPELDAGLGVALMREVCTEIGRPQVRLYETGVPFEVGVDTRRHLYRIVQEAVANARKHAGAEQVRVDLHWQPQQLEIRVSDDGRGMPARPRAGMGSHTIHERARVLGARVRWVSNPVGGTTVFLSLPRIADHAETGAAPATVPEAGPADLAQ